MAALILVFLLALAPAATLEPTLRPFADYEETGYLIMSALDGHGAAELKRELVRQLPPDVSLVLYGQGPRTDSGAAMPCRCLSSTPPWAWC